MKELWLMGRDLLRWLFTLRVVSPLIFWSWNAIFLSLVFLGILPYVVVGVVRDTLHGLIPWDFTLFSGVLCAIPAVSVAVGLLVLLRQPHKLLGLFYGLEAPLLVLCFFRLFLVRELTAPVALFLALGAVGTLFYAYELLRGFDARPGAAHLQLLGHSLFLVFGLLGAAVVAVHVPPAAVGLVHALLSIRLADLGRLLFSYHFFFFLMGSFLFFYSALLFLVAPLALIVLSVRSFRRVAALHLRKFGPGRSAALVLCGVALAAAGPRLLDRQHQEEAFARLKTPPKSDPERRALLAAGPRLREGLLNGYLGQYRYLGARGESNHVVEIYREAGFSEDTRQRAQALFNALISPFLYQGEHFGEDSSRAEELYEQFFDAPIQKADREAVLRALSATYSSDQREAGLLNVGQRKVHLHRQDVQVQLQGDAAEVEIHEEYRNRSTEQQEIFYYFNLPEGAAVTGLWLGDSDRREGRFPYVVAPRGAAQKVYRGEVQRRSDPALLEQIGPRQYRLRAFPILPRPPSIKGEGPPMHLWMTYAVKRERGGVPLPRLTEQRNLYFDRDSELLLQGQRRHLPRGFTTSDWLPAYAPAPAPAAPEAAADPALLQRLRGRRLAVLLDRTYSMERVRGDVDAALGALQRDLAGAAGVKLDLYLSAAPNRGEAPAVLRDYQGGAPAPLFFGSQRLRQIVDQYEAQRGDQAYDGVLLLTDEGGLELAKDAAKPEVPKMAPLWIVHLGGRLAPGYDDGTLALVQRSGGGVATDVLEAARGLAQHLGAPAAEVPVPEGAPKAEQALAARRLILAQTRRVQLGELAALDGLHQLAVRHSIISPYSSMLVLVNDEQRRLLKEAEQKADRFDRQVESGKETLTKVSSPVHVTGAPEPAEWLLMTLGAGLMGVLRRRRS